MCWITLTPSKNKRKSTSSDCSSADIVRVHHSPKPRFSDVTVSLPSIVTSTDDHHHHHHEDLLHLHPHVPEHLRPHAPLPHGLLHHHHRHPHLHPIHPLHLHPLAPLHGPGKKIRIEHPHPPPPTRHSSRPPPAPSSSTSSSSSSDDACPPKEPIYRTQIVEPAAVRATTRTALRDVRVRGRVRRLGGYDVSGRSVPWDWDCVSSTVGSSVRGGAKRKGQRKKGGGGWKYPPFGGAERWL
jgi:hypothetical protein